MECDNKQLDPNLKCAVCGNNEFDLREGFYFCKECGTKEENIREFEADPNIAYQNATITRTKKIKKDKAEKPNLTSWECYNYICRGLVNELVQLGAKEDVKLITLQIWAAYLRRMEVAFFNKKHSELPKLGVSFLKRDANILYNHAAKKRKERRKSASDIASSTGGASDSAREWRKSKRKLDESLYSATTDYSESRLSSSTGVSSSTGTTNHAIQLKFSSHARKAFKKRIPVKHLKKHEEDAEGILTCHDFPPKNQTLTEKELFVGRTTIRDIYTILAIALNLAEDEIQLVDLVRFIAEGHIGTQKVLQYFPENVASFGKTILKDINFYRYHEKITYRSLRENIILMAKFIGLQEYRTPDFLSLAKRYITELNLPPEMGTYVERLINLLPPQMKIRSSKMYPAYEARAMAYIVFVLKLLFGLDGHKEKEISEAAKQLNDEIHNGFERTESRHPKLFVWSEWVEYIEMRKVIIGQYNSTYSRLFNVEQSMSKKLDELDEILRTKNQRESLASDADREVSVKTEEAANNIKCIMEKYRTNNSNPKSQNEESDSITFQASYMPSDTYFKRIRLHVSINEENSKKNIKIPEFMRVDHTLRTFEPYLNSMPLKKFLRELGMRLNVKEISCSENRSYVGMFVNSRDNFYKGSVEADFKINEQEWLNSIVDEPFPEEVTFKEKLDYYEKQYMKKLESLALKRRKREFDDEFMSHKLTPTKKNEKKRKPPLDATDFDAASMASIDVFSEHNMDPIDFITFKGPRRNLDSRNIFERVEEEEELVDNGTEKNGDATNGKILTLVTSKMDYWLLIGHIAVMIDLKKKSLAEKFPRSFFWLLETCAQTIHIDWSVLYDQLMAIEIIFAYGIEPLDDSAECVHFNHFNRIKDIGGLVNYYREIW